MYSIKNYENLFPVSNDIKPSLDMDADYAVSELVEYIEIAKNDLEL